MTEEQRIAAIDALAEEILLKCKTNYSYHEAKEDLRMQTLNQLRTLHSEDFLSAKDVYEFLVAKDGGPYWEDATEEQKLKCENAVQAMKEILTQES